MKGNSIIAVCVVISFLAASCFQNETVQTTSTFEQATTTTTESVSTSSTTATETLPSVVLTTQPESEELLISDLIEIEQLPQPSTSDSEATDTGADAAPGGEVLPDLTNPVEMVRALDLFAADVQNLWDLAFESAGLPKLAVENIWVTEGHTYTSQCKYSDGSPLVVEHDTPNAFFCPVDNRIYMPVTSMIQAYNGLVFGDQTIPGDMVVGGIYAHEYGHKIVHTLSKIYESREGVIVTPPQGKNSELFPDCLAGMYYQALEEKGWIDPGDSDELRSVFNTLGDFNIFSPDHHGSPVTRETAVVTGMTEGLPACMEAYGFQIAVSDSTQLPQHQSTALSRVTNNRLNLLHDGTEQSGLFWVSTTVDVMLSMLGFQPSPQITLYRWYFTHQDIGNLDGCNFNWGPGTFGYCQAEDLQHHIVVGSEIFETLHSKGEVGDLALVLLIGNLTAQYIQQAAGQSVRHPYSDCVAGFWLGRFGGTVMNDQIRAAYQMINDLIGEQAVHGTTQQRMEAFMSGYTAPSSTGACSG